MNRAVTNTFDMYASTSSTSQGPHQSSSTNSAIHRVQQQQPAESHPLYPILKVIKEETKAQREEMKVMKAQLHQFNGLLCGLQDEVKKLTNTVKAANEKGFTIEDSVYKKELCFEVSLLFCKTPSRNPAKEDIGNAIVKVLKNDAKEQYKLKKAIVFCNRYLTYLRAEERRRLLGIRPCEAYQRYATHEFVEKFDAILKICDPAVLLQYEHTVAFLRTYVRTNGGEAKKDMYKAFEEWLCRHYEGGKPSSAVLEEHYYADHLYNYSSAPHVTAEEHMEDTPLDYNDGEQQFD